MEELNKQEDSKFYRGNRGTLLYIVDILYDYDGYEKVESLKGLIDEVREIALEQYRKEEVGCECENKES